VPAENQLTYRSAKSSATSPLSQAMLGILAGHAGWSTSDVADSYDVSRCAGNPEGVPSR
jgi:hypothetical protein